MIDTTAYLKQRHSNILKSFGSLIKGTLILSRLRGWLIGVYLYFLLTKILPRPERISLDLDDKLKLEFYKLEQFFKGDISLNPTVEETMVSYGDLLDTPGAIEEVKDYRGEIFDNQNRVVIEPTSKEMTKGNHRESLATYIKRNR